MNEMKSIEERLGKEGWTRRFIANEPRLGESVQLYEEAGFEVHLEPLPREPSCETCAGPDEESEEECRVCFDGFEDQYRIIFTRPGEAVPEDDLF
jgi:hypothetical protein